MWSVSPSVPAAVPSEAVAVAAAAAAGDGEGWGRGGGFLASEPLQVTPLAGRWSL